MPRFMMLVIPKGYESAAPGTMPDLDAITKMAKYNDELQKAGVVISMNGLHPPSMGARVTFPGGKPKVQDGPFSEAKEVLGGYWLIEVPSLKDAIDWATKVPPVEDFTIEVRQVQAMEDFPPEMQAVNQAYAAAQQNEQPG